MPLWLKLDIMDSSHSTDCENVNAFFRKSLNFLLDYCADRTFQMHQLSEQQVFYSFVEAVHLFWKQEIWKCFYGTPPLLRVSLETIAMATIKSHMTSDSMEVDGQETDFPFVLQYSPHKL
jgi:hypothetical protein